MSKKRLIKNKPTQGDLGLYTYKDNNPNDNYLASDSIALRYDKFSKQDLYSNSIGDNLNEIICDSKMQNAINPDIDALSFIGNSFIQINSMNIKNRGVNSDINDVYFRIYICSDRFFSPYNDNGTIKSHDEMKSVTDGFRRYKIDTTEQPALFFTQNGPNYNKNGSPGTSLFTDIRIAEQFDTLNVLQGIPVENVPSPEGSEDALPAVFVPEFSKKYEHFDPRLSLLKIGTFSNGTDSDYGNPIINAGDWSTLFQEDTENPIHIIMHMDGDMDTTFDKSRNETISIWSFDPSELFELNSDGTVAGGKLKTLEWDNHDIEKYSSNQDYTAAFTGEALSITINTLGGVELNIDNYNPPTEYIELNPLVTPPIVGYTGLDIDEFITKINPSSQILKSPETYGEEVGNNEIIRYTAEFADYIPISYVELITGDKDFQIYYESIDDRSLVSAPNEVNLSFDVSIHPEPYGSDGLTLFQDSNSIELISKFNTDSYNFTSEEGDTINVLNVNQSDYMFFVVDWDDRDDSYKTIADVLLDWPRTNNELLQKRNQNLYYVQYISNTAQTGFRNPLKHNYNTPGMKRIKTIMISHNSLMSNQGIFQSLETNRWKLITTKLFVDIPSNEFPDFGQVGGSDYTTLPWPYTTPIIGGVSEDSKYMKSINDILGGGNIGDLDIIDETFLVNAKENNELGKAIEKMDLEQIRFFNASYDMNTLLDIPISDLSITNVTPDYLQTLPFPFWYEEFDVNANGVVLDESDVNIWVNNGRPDIADWIARNINGDSLEESEFNLPLNQPYPPLPYPVVNTIMMSTQDELMSPMIPTYPIVNTIITNEESNQIQVIGNSGGPAGPDSSIYNPDPEPSIGGGFNWSPGGSGWEWTNVGGDSVDVYQWIYVGYSDDDDVSPPDDDVSPPPSVSYTCYDESALNYNSGGDYACQNNNCCIYLNNLVNDWIEYFNTIPQYNWNNYSTTVNDEGLSGLQQLQQFFIDDFATPAYVIINWAIDRFYVSTPDEEEVIGSGNFLIIDDGCDIPTEENEGHIFVQSNGRVLYNNRTNSPIHGFQFRAPASYNLLGAAGGAAGDKNFQITYNNTNEVLAFTLDGNAISEQCGTLLILDLMPDWEDEADNQSNLYNMVFSDFNSNPIPMNYFYWNVGCTDEYANNYDNNANWEDNSQCTYDDLVIVSDFYNFEQIERYAYLNPYNALNDDGTNYWDGESLITTFSEESSVGQIFIDDNSDNVLKENCKLELNLGSISDRAITDSGGNSNKGLLIGDYKIKKTQKNEPMRRDSYIRIPQKGKENGAL